MKMKKLFAVLLSVMMLLAMGTTAFAASGTNTSDGKITITNPVDGETYSVYQMFTLESYNKTDGSEAYAYTIDSTSEWYNFVKPAEEENEAGAGASYVTLEQYGNSTTYYVTWKGAETDEAYAAFAKAALAYAQTLTDENKATVSATAYGKLTTSAEGTTSLESSSNKEGGTTNIVSYDSNNGNLVFSNLNLGYYLVDSSLGALVMLNTTAKEITIQEKNSAPTVNKQVQEDSKVGQEDEYGTSNTAGITDTVTFKTTITIGVGAESYVLHDTMTEGLSFNADSVKVYKNSVDGAALTAGTDYTLKTSDSVSETAGPKCTFEIEFAQTYLDTLSANDTLIVVYTATVNSSAVIDGTDTNNNTNTTYLSYGDSSKTNTDTTTTYVYDVDIFKYTTKDGSEVGLSDAEFVLYKTVTNADSTTTTYYAKITGGKLTGWTKNSSSDCKEDSSDTTYATTLKSGSDGKISVDGLDADTYYLEETAAPDGYNKLAEPVKIVIDENGYVNADDTNTQGVEQVKVLNNTGSELPTTGGIGTTVFYIVGSLLVVGAVVFLVVRRRMRAEKQAD